MLKTIHQRGEITKKREDKKKREKIISFHSGIPADPSVLGLQQCALNPGKYRKFDWDKRFGTEISDIHTCASPLTLNYTGEKNKSN